MRTENFYARAFAVGAGALLVYLLYLVLRPVFAPIAWALFIAFLLNPLHARLCRRFHGRATLSAALLTALTLVVLLGPLAALGTAFAAEATDLLRRLQALGIDQKALPAYDLATVPVLGSAVAWLHDSFGVSQSQVYAWAADGARSIVKTLGSLGGGAVLGALGTAVGFAMTMFILFFAIRDGRSMLAMAWSLAPLPEPDRARLFEHLGDVTRAVVFGTGVTALIQGSLVGIGFALTGLPSPIVFGALAAICAFVPFAGTPIVWVPAAVALALQDRWLAAIFLFGWGTVTALLDNFLRPALASRRAEVHTLTVFIGVIGGVSAFGLIGFILGPLVLALFIAIVRFIVSRQECADLPALPEPTRRH